MGTDAEGRERLTSESARARGAFATEVGQALLANGAAAADAAHAARSILGAEDVSVVIGYDNIMVLSGAGPEQSTHIAGIESRGFNFGLYSEVALLADRLVRGRESLESARRTLGNVLEAKPRYPGWAARVAAGFAGGSASLIFGGNALVAAFGFAANVLIDWLFSVLGRRGWPLFFLQILTGMIAGGAAWLVRVIAPGANASALVVGVIIVMLAGMTSTGAVRDAITGWYVSAWGRIFDALMKTLGLIVGIRLVLDVARSAGVLVPTGVDVSMSGLPVAGLLVASGLVAIGFSIVAQNAPRLFAPCAVLCVAGAAIYLATLDLGVIWSSGLAALVIGFLSMGCTVPFKAPPAAFSVCAIVPLLPGVTLYQGLAMLGDPASHATNQIITALGTALALAAGLSFGEYLAVLLTSNVSRLRDQVFRAHFERPGSQVSRGGPSRRPRP